MEYEIITVFAFIIAFTLLWVNYEKVKDHTLQLREELEELRKERKVFNYLDCLTEDPKTLFELKENTNKLRYLLFNFKTINERLDSIVIDELKRKIEENNEKMKAVCEGYKFKSE